MSLLPNESKSLNVVGVAVGGSESRIHQQSDLPNVPPKLTPLLPPKQTINKSKDDINKINKVPSIYPV